MREKTMLHRQVHPMMIQNGRVTSQAFRPTPKDENKLSVYDGDQINAEQAWEHYTGELGFESAGVLAVTVAECEIRSLIVVPDPDPFPEHVLIDFNVFSTGKIRRTAKQLKLAAEAKGWQYKA